MSRFDWQSFECARLRVNPHTLSVLVNAYRKTLWLSGSVLQLKFKEQS